MPEAPVPADENGWIAVCSRDRLAERNMICVRAAGIDLLVVLDGADLRACERACPHEQADLALGRVAAGQLHCPRHRAWFSLVDGRMSPGWPSPALRRYPVREADGKIWIKARALPAS